MVIFGGSSGIGLATAVHAAKQGAAEICIVGRSQERLDSAVKMIEDAGTSTSVTSASVDVTNEAKVKQFVATLPDRSVDHLVTTPGGSARLENLEPTSRRATAVRCALEL